MSNDDTIDDDVQITPKTTVGQLTDTYEGRPFLAASDSPNAFECDFCSAGVSYAQEPTIAQYVADDILGPVSERSHPKARQVREMRPLVQLASYCPDCSHRRLYFPCEGYAEARLYCELVADEESDSGVAMQNVRVTDVSPRDDGIPWDPEEVAEAITGVPYADLGFFEHDLFGPENTVTFFLSSVQGVDIRELVQWDGSLDPKVLGRARRKFEEFHERMRTEGHSRKKFRDHVRGEDT